VRASPLVITQHRLDWLAAWLSVHLSIVPKLLELRESNPLSALGRSVERMTRQHWEHRLPDGVQVHGRDSDGFRLGVSIPVGDDGLWPMRCPQEPREHAFKVQVTQEQESASPVHCPYCGYRADLWAFAPEQLAVVEAAAEAVADQHFAAEVNDMLRRTFGGRPHASSSHSGFGIDISYRSDPPPPRRSLPTFEVEEARRTMECERCQERFAVYGLAIYCPSCGQVHLPAVRRTPSDSAGTPRGS